MTEEVGEVHNALLEARRANWSTESLQHIKDELVQMIQLAAALWDNIEHQLQETVRNA